MREIGIKPGEDFPFAPGGKGEEQGAARLLRQSLGGVPGPLANQVGDRCAEAHANGHRRLVDQTEGAAGQVGDAEIGGDLEPLPGDSDPLQPIDQKEAQGAAVVGEPAQVKGIFKEKQRVGVEGVFLGLPARRSVEDTTTVLEQQSLAQPF